MPRIVRHQRSTAFPCPHRAHLPYHRSVAVTVTHSPLRLLAHVLLAVPAVLLAIDMTLSHALYRAPDSVDTVVGSTLDQFGNVVEVTGAALTQQGQAEARRDRVFAAALMAGGIMSIAWAMRELLRPRALFHADRDGLAVRVPGSGDEGVRSFSWDRVVEVRSGILDLDGEELPGIVVRSRDDENQPDELQVVAEDWSPPAHLVVPLIERLSPNVPVESDGG